MSRSRVFLLIGLFIVVSAASWLYLGALHKSPVGDSLTVYYTKVDGSSEVPWSVSMRPQAGNESGAEHLQNAALYAAVQAVAGPPGTVEAIRFPSGTQVRSVTVTGKTADVDLSGEVKNTGGGSFGESGEFKALVWTLTQLPGIEAVGIRVDGRKLDALPGGHLALDQPLRRTDW